MKTKVSAAQKLQDKVFKKMTASDKLKTVDRFYKSARVLNDKRANPDRTTNQNRKSAR